MLDGLTTRSIPLLVGVERGGPNLGLARTAFRDAQSGLSLLQAPLMGLAHGKLGVVETVSCGLLNIFVDRQYLWRQSFGGWVKQWLELVLDAFHDHDAEGVQILCYGVDSGVVVKQFCITPAKKGRKGAGGERNRRHGKDDAAICA